MPGSSVNQEFDRVQEHFHRTARSFDSIYSGKKSAFGRLLDRLLRWDMQERFRLTLEACRPVAGKTVLDAGCGTGRFCFPLAEEGAAEVVGIDFAAAMIAEAQRIARQTGLDATCRFEQTDILQFSSDEKFDYVLAVGLFDYIRDGRPMMQKLRQLTRGRAIITFPRSHTWRAPIRKIRLSLLGCPVFFYDEKQIRDHLMMAGFSVQRITGVGQLYFVIAD